MYVSVVVGSPLEPNSTSVYAFEALSVANAVELLSVKVVSFDISFTLYPDKENDPLW